ncbi:AAA family ATPase [Rhizobium sp. MHM7A]|uniref:AAA family ATPase n=1 Tax=Rhizobium sp. MHM7A TaxID=2583233 RepID=UPI001106C52F|nr:AAA family ATPase [Rhizobium sp. MHM7A]TLX16771.1 AAA family ATPase [Rhizobium sp. MHM7A]
MRYFDLGMDKKLIVPYADYLKAMKPDFAFIGDTGEIVDLVRCLYLPSANSVKLVGSRGAGVTALMDALVHHQTSSFMPDDFMVRPIFKFNANSLFSTSDSGLIEKRFYEALEELQRHNRQRRVKPIVIIDDGTTFIDNAPQHVVNGLIEAAIRADYVDIIIGVDKKHIDEFHEAHPEFKDNFSRKDINEPQRDQLLEIVRHHAKKHAAKNVILTDEVLLHAIDITDRFKSMYDTAQPNRVIRLIDSAATAFRIKIHSNAPGSYEKELVLNDLVAKGQMSGFVENDENNPYAREIASLRDALERASVQWDGHREQIKAHQEDIRKFEAMIGSAQMEIEKLDEETRTNTYNDLKDVYFDTSEGDALFKGRARSDILNLDRDSLLKFAQFDMSVHRNPRVKELNSDIAKWTQAIQRKQEELLSFSDVMHQDVVMPPSVIDDEATKVTKSPVGGISGRLRENLRNGVSLMKESVYGQDHVIEPIVKALQRAAAGLNDPDKPLGVFMIAGPPGTGKTWTAKQLAVKLFGSEDYYEELNMNDYGAEHNVSSLFGAPPGYAGHGKKGRLIQIGQDKPFCVLCLDEIEKAHYDVRQALLTVMSAGRAVGLDGEVADFRNIIIIATSNFGNDRGIWNGEYEEGVVLFNSLIRSSGQDFSPEYLDRHDALLCAGPLDRESLAKIIVRAVKTLEKNAQRNNPDFDLVVDDASISRFVEEHCIGKSGRHAGRLINQVIGDKLVDIILSASKVSGSLMAHYDMTNKAFAFDFKAKELAEHA